MQKVTIVRPKDEPGAGSDTKAKKKRIAPEGKRGYKSWKKEIGQTILPFQQDGVQTSADTCVKRNTPYQTSQLNHSMVSSCKMICASPQDCGRGIEISSDKLVLPVRQVSSTDSVSIGSALLANLEEYVFGGDFEAWLSTLDQGSQVVIAMAMDSATANVKLCKTLRCYVERLSEKYKVQVVLHTTRCCLHRTSRIVVKFVVQYKLEPTLFCATTSVRMRKTHKQVCDVYKERCKCIDFMPGRPPPCDRRRYRIKVLREMLLYKEKKLWKPKKGSSGVSSDDWEKLVDLLLDGDQEGPWIPLKSGCTARHSCNGKCTLSSSANGVNCRDKEGAVKLLCQCFDRVYARSTSKFQTGRWTKM